jgi:hypothetical protein
MIRATDRRHFILAATAIASATCYPHLTSFADEANPGESTSVSLTPAVKDLYRVRMEIAIEGNVNVPKNSLISKERAKQLPVRGTSTIDYEERFTRNAATQPAAAKRYYYEAVSETTISGNTSLRQLRKASSRAVAHVSNGPEIIVGEKGYLTHDEIELLHTPICSLAIDSLLPNKPVSKGESWPINDERLATLLNLDAVQQSTLVGEVVAIEKDAVKLQLKGRVDGSIDGVPTSLDLAGKVTFDRPSQAVSWLALAVREVREIGKAKPGFEIAATIKLVRQSLDKPNAIVDETPLDLAAGISPRQMLVQIESAPGKFTAFMDRDWRVISDKAGLTTLRMVSDDKAISQCELRPLTNLKAGEQLTLEAYQAEIKKSLEQRFGEFIEAEEGLNGGGLRAMRVAVQGQVQDVPVQWVFLQFSDDNGRRLGATFTVESANVETFGGSDAQLANSLYFHNSSTTNQSPANQGANQAAGPPKSVVK